MITEKKIKPAFLALQQIFIAIRFYARKEDGVHIVEELSDGAEYLANLCVKDEDMSEKFILYLEQMATTLPCKMAVDAFSNEHS